MESGPDEKPPKEDKQEILCQLEVISKSNTADKEVTRINKFRKYMRTNNYHNLLAYFEENYLGTESLRAHWVHYRFGTITFVLAFVRTNNPSESCNAYIKMIVARALYPGLLVSRLSFDSDGVAAHVYRTVLLESQNQPIKPDVAKQIGATMAKGMRLHEWGCVAPAPNHDAAAEHGIFEVQLKTKKDAAAYFTSIVNVRTCVPRASLFVSSAFRSGFTCDSHSLSFLHPLHLSCLSRTAAREDMHLQVDQRTDVCVHVCFDRSL